jgi:hypothetical protein
MEVIKDKLKYKKGGVKNVKQSAKRSEIRCYL